jgi:DNA-binding response OmpR family regulator
MGILIIEDEKKVAGFIKRGLEAESHEVEVCYDGEEGFRKALENSYSLIILDVVLPLKDGLSIVRDLRAAKLTIPVLILTARNSVDDIVTGLDSGSDDYLAKPFALAELLARVRALLRRSGQDRGSEIRFADMRLDPVTRRVWRKDKEISLTPREYSLLEFFMRNPDQLLTRATIADNVWTDSDFDRFTNIVDVYINYLRRKIDRGTDRKLIHTIRRAGYIMREA